MIAAVSAFGQVQTQANVAVCGTVDAFVASSALSNGLITISGTPFVIAAGTTLQNQNLAVAGATVCLSAAVNAQSQLTTPATLTANVQSQLSLCGTVTAYTAATSVTNGSLTIAGRTISIAAGTTITNSSLIQTGVNLCLAATVNGLGQVVAPSSVNANVTSRVTICGTVSAYAAATGSAAGSITIGGQSYTIAAGTTINGEVRVGMCLCLDATVDATKAIVSPTSVTANRAPSLVVPGSRSVQIGATLRFTVTASDPDRCDSVTITAQNLPPNATFPQPPSGNPTSGDFTFTPTSSQMGDITVSFTASDGHGGTTNASVAITVTPSGSPSNQPPHLTVPGPQTVQAGSTLQFSVNASDPDSGDSVHISAANVPANASFTPTDGNPASGSVTFTPNSSQVGTFTVSFTATDNRGAADSGSVTITVTASSTPDNKPPDLRVPGPQTVQAGATLRFSVNATDADTADTIHMSASNVPPNASFTPNDGNPANGSFTFTPASSQVGRVTVSFTASDNHGATDTDSVTITVTAAGSSNPPGGEPTNHAPVLSVPDDQFVSPGDTLRFTVTAVDNDGDSVTIQAGPLPRNASFTPNGNSGTFTMTPTSDQVGEQLEVTFIATDSKGAQDSDGLAVHVVATPNKNNPPQYGPPILSVPRTITVNVGDTLNFIVTATPQEPNCSVTLNASGLPPGASFDAASGRVSFTPAADQIGHRFHITFNATDCSMRLGTDSVDVIVVDRPGNNPNPPAGTPPSKDFCVPVTEIVFNGSCGAVSVPVVNGSNSPVTVTSIALQDGRFFTLSGAPNRPIVMPPNSSLSLEIRLNNPGGEPVVDRLQVRTGDDGATMTEVILQTGQPRRRSVSP